MSLQFQWLARFGTKKGGLESRHLFLSYVNECFLYVDRRALCACSARGDQKRTIDFPQLELLMVNIMVRVLGTKLGPPQEQRSRLWPRGS